MVRIMFYKREIIICFYLVADRKVLDSFCLNHFFVVDKTCERRADFLL